MADKCGRKPHPFQRERHTHDGSMRELDENGKNPYSVQTRMELTLKTNKKLNLFYANAVLPALLLRRALSCDTFGSHCARKEIAENYATISFAATV